MHADLLDAAATMRALSGEPFDRVVHLAARTNARESFADPVGYFAMNVTGTVNLLAALRESHPSSAPGIVFASTHAVYGSQRAGLLSEDDPVHPESPYAASKVAAEQLLNFHARTGQIGAVVLRCFNVAGGVDGITDPDRSRLIPRIIEAARTGQPIPINGDGSVQRDFVHVVDVARAVRLTLGTVKAGAVAIYNVGSGRGTSVSEMLATAREVFGKKVTVEHRAPGNEPRVVIADTKVIHAELDWAISERSEITSILLDSVQ